ncbi:LacI family DNA-binding transcriptional regulator [Spirochaeta isovalerica]|uniref:LacI family transcriptional regulator n=1 Tax=Spirochaeta isovalerica TaxID=150 RepID=A0A841RCX9_9SPIO|nr:LacI family DNA-binding transcriptional regulator [Spirochaeta isovalerica]MBB6480508.1 LacI family transcriptional regulator [Spirochaeta isovalerica]
MSITIKDVARESGVSISTVSKVINGSSRISSSTKEKVRAVMTELDYHPSSTARNLVRQRTGNICVVKGLGEGWDWSSNPYVYEILNGVEYRAGEEDYLLSIVNVRKDKPLMEQLEKYIFSRRIDGFLIFAGLAEKDLTDSLIRMNFPFVLIGDPGDGRDASWVDLNNTVAGHQATEELYSRGRRNFLCLREKKDKLISGKRLAGVRDFLNGHGLEKVGLTVKTVENGMEGGRDFALAAEKEIMNHDAVICCGSISASGLLSGLSSKGIAVPRDISIISFDRYPVSDLTDPPLSVIDMNLKELGDRCCSALLARIEDKGFSIQLTVSSSSFIPGGTV